MNKYQLELDTLDIGSDDSIRAFLLGAYDAAVHGDSEAIRFLAWLMAECEDSELVKQRNNNI
jgi:hypothetical protein